MGYNKMTPRSNRIDGRHGKEAADLEARGRVFYCLDCTPGEGKLLAGGAAEVVGTLVSGFFHKGHLGHRVSVALGKVCSLPACGCDGSGGAHA